MSKPKAIGLVVVLGGVAEVHAPRHVDIRVVDIDNIKAGDEPLELPAGVGFERLVKDACLDVSYVQFAGKRRKHGR